MLGIILILGFLSKTWVLGNWKGWGSLSKNKASISLTDSTQVGLCLTIRVSHILKVIQRNHNAILMLRKVGTVFTVEINLYQEAWCKENPSCQLLAPTLWASRCPLLRKEWLKSKLIIWRKVRVEAAAQLNTTKYTSQTKIPLVLESRVCHLCQSEKETWPKFELDKRTQGMYMGKVRSVMFKWMDNLNSWNLLAKLVCFGRKNVLLKKK